MQHVQLIRKTLTRSFVFHTHPGSIAASKSKPSPQPVGKSLPGRGHFRVAWANCACAVRLSYKDQEGVTLFLRDHWGGEDEAGFIYWIPAIQEDCCSHCKTWKTFWVIMHNKLIDSVLDHYFLFFSFLLYMVGLVFLCLLPNEDYSRRMFFDENALMAGLVNREFEGQNTIKKFAEEIQMAENEP